MTIPHQGLGRGTREVNLDTQSCDSSAEEMGESGRTF